MQGEPGILVLHVSAGRLLEDEDASETGIAPLCKLIDKLNERFKGRMIVLTSSGFLANAQLSLSDNSSWEAFALDLMGQWNGIAKLDPAATGLTAAQKVLATLSKCEDVIVRQKAHFAIRFRQGLEPRLYYLVESTHSLFSHLGYVIGYNTIISACLAPPAA